MKDLCCRIQRHKYRKCAHSNTYTHSHIRQELEDKATSHHHKNTVLETSLIKDTHNIFFCHETHLHIFSSVLNSVRQDVTGSQ